MSNDYYNHGSVPATGSSLSSATMRAEFDAIATGMDKLPPLTGNNNEVVVVNAGATGQSSVPRAALIDTTIVDAADKATPVDVDLLPLVDSAAANALKKLTWANLKATLKTYFDSVTTTLTNKTLTSPVISGGTINGATVGATTPSTGAFTTLTASGDTSAGTSGSGAFLAKGALAAHQTNAGVLQYASNVTTIRSYGATAGTGQIAFNAGGGGGNPDAEVARISSTGLAVTGALSASGVFSLNGSQFAANSASTNYQYSDTNGIIWRNKADNATIASLSNTGAMTVANGLAVTGALSATGDGTLGSAGNNAKLALGNQSGSYYGYVHQDAAVTGKMRYNSYAVAGTTHGHQWEINGISVATLDAAGNLGLGVTPSAWGSQKALDFAYGGLSIGGSLGVELVANAYYNGTNWIYRATSSAMRYEQDSNGHKWFTAPSGTAGNAITFTQAMTLDASGRHMVGTTDASGANLSGTVVLNPTAGTSVAIGHITGTTSGATYSYYMYNGTIIGSITQSGTTAVAFNTTSDHRLKENVRPADAARFMDIEFVDFEWVDGRHDCGVIAHQLQSVYPDLVIGEKDATEVRTVEITPAVPEVKDEEGNVVTEAVPAVTEEQTFPVYQQVNYIGLIGRMGTRIQSLQRTVDAQAEMLAAMEARLAALEAA